MSQVLYFYSLIIVSGIVGMISWNTQIRGQLLANCYAYTRGHCKQICCYNSLHTYIGVNICHPKERETICYVVYVKCLVQQHLLFLLLLLKARVLFCDQELAGLVPWDLPTLCMDPTHVQWLEYLLLTYEWPFDPMGWSPLQVHIFAIGFP